MARQLIKNRTENAYELALSVECARVQDCRTTHSLSVYPLVILRVLWKKGIPLAHPTNCKLRTVHRIRDKQTRRINRRSNSWVEELRPSTMQAKSGAKTQFWFIWHRCTPLPNRCHKKKSGDRSM